MSLLEDIQSVLMKGRTWQYLRYVHLRESIASIAHEIETVCVAGAGRGLAEFAVGLEFPHLRWTLTDIMGVGYPSYHSVMRYCWRHQLDNIAFSVWNVMEPTKRRYDLVCSTEMLEHIPDAVRAAQNMRATASKYVYCLVPFADAKANLNPEKRRWVWDKAEHFVCGYDQANLETLFGTGGRISGTYWTEAGVALRQELHASTNEAIAANMARLQALAAADLRPGVPRAAKQALGIKILVRADAPATTTPSLPPAFNPAAAPAAPAPGAAQAPPPVVTPPVTAQAAPRPPTAVAGLEPKSCIPEDQWTD
jgi:hypothetical protein